jgi:hypothetical protein
MDADHVASGSAGQIVPRPSVRWIPKVAAGDAGIHARGSRPAPRGRTRTVVHIAMLAELKEREHRIGDAVRNAKAAVEEGLLPGGGVALANAVATSFRQAGPDL